MIPPRPALLLAYLATAAVALCAHGSPLDGLADLKDYTAARVSSHDRGGGNADALHGVGPGDTAVLADIQGPGMISHIWITIAAEKWHGRKIILRIFWDDETDPSVLSPINDFFCTGHGINAEVRSLPITVTSKGRARNCFFPMPFNRRARVEITNEGMERIGAFYYYVDYRTYPRPFQHLATFHARYRQEYPALAGRNYRICETTGRGHFVGCNLSIESNGNAWWGEGDDRFFVDGQAYPSFHGTGSEDYLCDAWGIWPGDSPFYGSPIHEGPDYAEGKRYTSYRFHIADPIPFTTSFLAEIEHYGAVIGDDGRMLTGFAERDDNWSSVAYWYQVEPHTTWEPMPPVEQRLPREAENEIRLIGFLKEAPAHAADGDIAALRATYEAILAAENIARHHDKATVAMALAEHAEGNDAEADRLIAPFSRAFVDRDFASAIARIRGEDAIANARPVLVRSDDGSALRAEIDGTWTIVTRRDERKPFIYFSLPEDSPVRNIDDTVGIRLRCRAVDGTETEMMIEYDSFYGDDVPGVYHDTETVRIPAAPGWHTADFTLPRARLDGHQNSGADFRIAPLGPGDIYIADITILPASP